MNIAPHNTFGVPVTKPTFSEPTFSSCHLLNLKPAVEAMLIESLCHEAYRCLRHMYVVRTRPWKQ